MTKANTSKNPANSETKNEEIISGSGTARSYLLLKSATAKKLGKKSEGGIAYRILSDTDRTQLHITITDNDGGGYFSKEAVEFSQIEKCLNNRPADDKPFPSKLFKGVFVGRSSNNPGFMAAILRNEGLLAQAPEVESQHVVAGDWAAWKAALMALEGSPVTTDSAPTQSTDAPQAAEKRKTLTLKRTKATESID